MTTPGKVLVAAVVTGGAYLGWRWMLARRAAGAPATTTAGPTGAGSNASLTPRANTGAGN